MCTGCINCLFNGHSCLSHHALLSLAQMVNDTLSGCDPCTMHYAMAKITHCPSHHVLPSLARMVSDMAIFESGDLDTITCAVILYGVMLLLSLWLLCNRSWRVSSMVRLWAKYLQTAIHYCSLYWAVMHVTMQPRQNIYIFSIIIHVQHVHRIHE